MTIHVALVDNRRLMAMGLKQLLETEGDIRVLDVRTDCHAPCSQDCMQSSPDVLILETNLNGACGLDCMHRIIARHPETRLMVLSHDTNAVTMQYALSLGALGFLGKNATPGELLTAVRKVAAGEEYIGQNSGRNLMYRRLEGEGNIFLSLTRREHEIMLLILDGHSASKISGMLSISPKTLANHHTRILRKLDVGNTVDLTRLAIRHGIIKAGLLLTAVLPELILLF